MSPAELAEQARVIDAMNRGFEEEGDAFRVLRSMEVDLFPDGTLDMDDDSLASLDLVLGAFHSELRSKDDQTERYLAALNQPRLDLLAHPKAGCTAGGSAWLPNGAACSPRRRGWGRRWSSTRRCGGRI